MLTQLVQPESSDQRVARKSVSGPQRQRLMSPQRPSRFRDRAHARIGTQQASQSGRMEDLDEAMIKVETRNGRLQDLPG